MKINKNQLVKFGSNVPLESIMVPYFIIELLCVLMNLFNFFGKNLWNKVFLEFFPAWS